MAHHHVVEDDCSDDERDLAFASIDLSGVNFDDTVTHSVVLAPHDEIALRMEQELLFPTEIFQVDDDENFLNDSLLRLKVVSEQIKTGKYIECLKRESAKWFLEDISVCSTGTSPSALSAEVSVAYQIRDQVWKRAKSVAACVEMEFLGIAALNLFQQVNYTGPALDDNLLGTTAETPFASIDPHECFVQSLLHSTPPSADPPVSAAIQEEKKELLTAPKRNVHYHNRVLSEIAVEGQWPSQVCQVPYLLLFARSVLLPLANPKQSYWSSNELTSSTSGEQCPPSELVAISPYLKGARVWSVRAAVAHERLLQIRGPTMTLWKEVDAMFEPCRVDFCGSVNIASASSAERRKAATIMLEWGLAEYHFDRPKGGRLSFLKAMEYSGLTVEVTGAEGKRTKFQQKATAQMVVRASSLQPSNVVVQQGATENGLEAEAIDDKQHIKSQMIEHSEEEILWERIRFTDDKENQIPPLTILDQSILLALCLDVKNNNPVDGLTAEEMGAYLARVLDHHDDWMVYATALLERAWLEFERSHGRERAILQIQALTDQHTNRLTITQSTRKSIEESATAEERLAHIHSIVYPPRWAMLRDLAERYAALGVVTTAAEIFTEIELWDEVVECYRRAGKENIAEKIVRERLAVAETPRMWTALGDLTQDPTHYERAIELSNGRFSNAFTALGRYYFDKEEFQRSLDYYEKALKIQTLAPAIWFRVGTISMKLEKWDKALQAFSVVVQQEPEEADAWANVAAVHMHNKKPAEAYPALVEVCV
jgi:tetratricopeptide (TPR) repeat protein